MTQHKTAELTGALLDAAVALADGYEFHKLIGDWPDVLPWLLRKPGNPVMRFVGPDAAPQGMIWIDEYNQAWRFAPSIAWEHGGPIIERERITLNPLPPEEVEPWAANMPDINERSKYGPAPLIAAMRAYTASVFGEEVELP